MSKKYTFTLVLHEQNDEWWEEIERNKSSGCNELTKLVDMALANVGFNVNCEHTDDTLTLSKFEDN